MNLINEINRHSSIIDKFYIFFLGEVPEFLLGHNPFFCDCEMEWLQQINQMAHHRQHPRVLDLDNVY